MNAKEFTQIAKTKLETLTVNELKIELTKLMDNHESGSALVWSAALDVLESKISEKEFVEFCDNL